MVILLPAKSGRPIRVVDAAGNPWDETRAIGNGSKVKASINPYNWNYRGKTGIGAGLNQVMVWNGFSTKVTMSLSQSQTISKAVATS